MPYRILRRMDALMHFICISGTPVQHTSQRSRQSPWLAAETCRCGRPGLGSSAHVQPPAPSGSIDEPRACCCAARQPTDETGLVCQDPVCDRGLGGPCRRHLNASIMARALAPPSWIPPSDERCLWKACFMLSEATRAQQIPFLESVCC